MYLVNRVYYVLIIKSNSIVLWSKDQYFYRYRYCVSIASCVGVVLFRIFDCLAIWWACRVSCFRLGDWGWVVRALYIILVQFFLGVACTGIGSSTS